MRLNRAAAGVLAAIMLIGLAACGSDDPENGVEPTPTDPTSGTESTEPSPTDDPTTSEPATDEDKATEALLGYLEVRDQAYATGRISKKLNKYATGREHFALQQFVRQLNEGEFASRFEGEWSHEVIDTKAQSGEEVLVTNCEDSSGVNIIRNSDGSAAPWFTDESGNELPRRLEQKYRVVLEGDTWKVESGASNPNRPQTC